MTSSGYERRHDQKERNGTWETLADPIVLMMREEPSYKETKSKEVGRVADDVVVSMMFRESGTEKRTSAEFKHLKNGRSVYYPDGVEISQHESTSGCLENAVPEMG